MINSQQKLGLPIMVKIIKISDQEYLLFKKFVYDRFGIDLGFHKKSLVMGRLNKILRQRGFEDFKTYYRYLKEEKSGEALTEFINKISTNHTFFNRESAHYEYMYNKHLPEIIDQIRQSKEDKIRIWSAACSSGEEVYNLAMIINEFLLEHKINKDFVILGTDISMEALEKADRGIYSDENVKKLPVSLKLKYLRPTTSDQWEVVNHLKSKVVFKKLNLISPSFPFKKKFHAVFCRNVMIYFDNKTRTELINKIHPHLTNQGRLFIGLSESIQRTNEKYRYQEPGIYKKVAVN